MASEETRKPAGWIVWDEKKDAPVYGYGPYERQQTARAICTRAKRYHQWAPRPAFVISLATES